MQEGYIKAGDTFHLLERPYSNWTITTCNEVMHHRKHDLERSARLAACELLAPSWRNTLHKRAQRGEVENTRNRLIGPNE